MNAIRIAIALSSITGPLAAQWLNYPTPGIPRTADGKPNLSAPAPRTPDGKPDLSGLWSMDGGKYIGNIAAELKPGDLQPWAEALLKQRAVDLGKDDPADIYCLPQGPRANLYPLPEKIIQTPNLIVILTEDLTYRQIFLDGRDLPKDPNPSFMGYSIGHWDRDTLVVESNGFNDRLWLDLAGHPHTEAMQVTERFQRTDFGHMRIEETIDDPKTYNKPFTIHINANYYADSELLEYVCAEGEKDRNHLVGKATDDKPVAVKVPPEVLAKYVGTYDYRFPESPSVPVLIHITLSDGQLRMDNAPLIPLSDTVFAAPGVQRVTFFMNDRGVVTHLTRPSVEGDNIAPRIQEQ